MQPLSLYELTEDLLALEDALIESGGELTPEIEAQYSDLLEMHADKVVSYIAMIRKFEASAKAIKEEADRLSAAAKTMQTAGQRLKQRLHDAMVRRGETEHQTRLGKVKVVRAGGKPPLMLLVEDPEDLPERFRRVSVSADKSSLLEALDAGDEEARQYAQIGERGTYLRIY